MPEDEVNEEFYESNKSGISSNGSEFQTRAASQYSSTKSYQSNRRLVSDKFENDSVSTKSSASIVNSSNASTKTIFSSQNNWETSSQSTEKTINCNDLDINDDPDELHGWTVGYDKENLTKNNNERRQIQRNDSNKRSNPIDEEHD